MNLTHDFIINILWTISWQTSLMFIIIGITSLIFRKKGANFKYMLWLAVIARLCIPVALSFPTGLFKTPEPSLLIPAERIEKTVEQKNETASPISTLPIAEKTDISTIAQKFVVDRIRQTVPVETKLIYSWLSFMALMGLGFCIQYMRIHSKLSKMKTVESPHVLDLFAEICKELDLKTQIQIRAGNDQHLSGPTVFGLIHPTIYLPQNMLEEWTEEELKPVLLHEATHIQRKDLWVNLIQIAVQTIYFFHPLVWLVNWKIRQLREEICDDIAIQHLGANKKQYGESILRIVENSEKSPMETVISMQFIESRNSVAKRIIRIMSKNYRFFRKLRPASIMGIGLIALIGTGLSCNKMDSKNESMIHARYKPLHTIIEDLEKEFKISIIYPSFMEKYKIKLNISRHQKLASILDQIKRELQKMNTSKSAPEWILQEDGICILMSSSLAEHWKKDTWQYVVLKAQNIDPQTFDQYAFQILSHSKKILVHRNPEILCVFDNESKINKYEELWKKLDHPDPQMRLQFIANWHITKQKEALLQTLWRLSKYERTAKQIPVNSSELFSSSLYDLKLDYAFRIKYTENDHPIYFSHQNQWILLSKGPDLQFDIQADQFSIQKDLLKSKRYDPTNGLISIGDLYISSYDSLNVNTETEHSIALLIFEHFNDYSSSQRYQIIKDFRSNHEFLANNWSKFNTQVKISILKDLPNMKRRYLFLNLGIIDADNEVSQYAEDRLVNFINHRFDSIEKYKEWYSKIKDLNERDVRYPAPTVKDNEQK